MTLVKNTLLLATTLGLLACSDGAVSPPGDNAEATVDAFSEARDALNDRAESHTATVMAQQQLRDITLDELGFHDDSLAGLNEMQWHLESLAACLNDQGTSMDREGALAALQDLRSELRAHQVSMITMVDTATARAAEQVFHARQAPLLEELDAYVQSFALTAKQYECTF